MRRRALLAATPLLALGACAAPRPAGEPVHIVFFEDDSVAVSPAAMAEIQLAARAAAARPDVPVRVLGFVAPEPGLQGAVQLSRRRADAVAAELRQMGVAPGRILVRGRGAVPFAEAPVESRRVEIRIGAE